MIVMTTPRHGLAIENMAGPNSNNKISFKPKRFMASKTAVWLGPLVFYSLLQIATNLFETSHHTNNKEDYSTALNQLHYESNNIFTTTQSHHLCSSTSAISKPLLSSSLSYSNSQSSSSTTNNYLSPVLRFLDNAVTIFGPKVMIAEAASPYQSTHQDKCIIILNSTNFNAELIQYKHPFPHIKLIEYFVSFCGYCRDFKATYNKLAKEIYPWRNVIRPSAIDISVSSNSPIAHSWSVQEVPTLRIHPPLKRTLAEKLDKHLTSLSATLSPVELQKAMFEEYNSSELMVQSLKVTDYKDKVPLLKQDLLRYIERYVHERPTEIPVTWPNLKPVIETSLADLRRGHPRQELFLIIDGTVPSTSDSDQSSSSVGLSFNIMMELSSSAAWKAIRYVRASENKALIEDVIAQQSKFNSELKENQIAERVKLLTNLLSNQQNDGNNIILLHIDDSHSPIRTEGTSSALPFITLVTSVDLVTIEKSVLDSQNSNRAKRATRSSERFERASYIPESSPLNKLSDERKVELFSLYIKQTYTETSEDREFVEAINNFDALSRAEEQFLLGLRYIIAGSLCCLVLIVFLRCTTYYLNQAHRRHKATLMNGSGNGNHYSVELQ